NATVARRRKARRHVVVGQPGRVLRLVVVDAPLRRYLDGAEHAAVQDGDLDFLARDEALDQRNVVERQRGRDRAVELRKRARLRHTEGRTLAPRLDDDRKAE